MNSFLKQPIAVLLDTKGGKITQVFIVLLSVCSWIYFYLNIDTPPALDSYTWYIFAFVWLFSTLFTVLLGGRYILKFIGKKVILAVIVVIIILPSIFSKVEKTKQVAHLENTIIENQLLLRPQKNLTDSEFYTLLLPITEERCYSKPTILESGESTREKVCYLARIDTPGVKRRISSYGEYNYGNNQYEFGANKDIIFPGGPWDDNQALGFDFLSCGTRGCSPVVWFYFIDDRIFAAVDGTPIDQVNYRGLYILETDGSQWRRIIEANAGDIYFLENGCDIIFKNNSGNWQVNWCQSLSN